MEVERFLTDPRNQEQGKGGIEPGQGQRFGTMNIYGVNIYKYLEVMTLVCTLLLSNFHFQSQVDSLYKFQIIDLVIALSHR